MPVELEEGKDHRDYTKWVWGGIVLAAIAMLAALTFSNRTNGAQSQVEVKHILVKFTPNDAAQRQRALETIAELRKRILAGESFEKLAKEYSDDPQSGARGGYLGWGDKGIYDKNFEEYVWHAELNKLSEVITTSFGYHLIVVMNRHLSNADKYDQEIESKANKQAPGVEVTTPKGVPQAKPVTPEIKVPAINLPPAEPVPPAAAAPATPALETAPAPVTPSAPSPTSAPPAN